jgi:aldose 1-epimerase
VTVDDVVLHVPGRNRLLVDGRLLPIGAAKVAGSEFDFSVPKRIGGLALDTAFGDLIRDEGGGSTVTLSVVDSHRRARPEESIMEVREVRVWADAGFRWWQVFTSDGMSGARRRRSIAVEPMTCPPDAFRSGRDVVVLEPEQTWSGEWSITPVAARP